MIKILAPVNNPEEVERIIDAGASEIYCGVLPEDWLRSYGNIASTNRREWKTANLKSFSSLKKTVDKAHKKNTPVYLAMNGLYSQGQYPLLLKQAKEAETIGVDALIVADLGLLLTLKKEKSALKVHISTGGTAFNSQTVKFYEDLGVSRIILPRHLNVEEIAGIIRDCPSMDFEVFILNSGCKNIDGFCTFQHGVNEILHGKTWDLPKKLNFDRHLLKAIRILPACISRNMKIDFFGVDSACLLSYKVGFHQAEGLSKAGMRRVLKNVSSCFGIVSGIDTCGACRLPYFKKIGVKAVKIVGRNYSTGKKTADVSFLKMILDRLENDSVNDDYIKKTFKRVYGMKCKEFCYYPEK